MTDLQVPTSLYRLKAGDGKLLYVGIAGNPGRRFEQHKKDKPWWGEVVFVELSHYKTRDDALDAEAKAIANEKPAYNVMLNGSGDKGLTLREGLTVKAKPESRPLEPGYCVGVALREPICSLRYYVGEVQAVDELGIRITGIDWMVGMFCGFDHWFPWSNILGLKDVATEAHSLHDWASQQGSSQRRHNGDPPLQREASESSWKPVDLARVLSNGSSLLDGDDEEMA